MAIIFMRIDETLTQALRTLAHQKKWVGQWSKIGAIWILPLLIFLGGCVHGFSWRAWGGYGILLILLWLVTITTEYLIGRARPFLVSKPLPLLHPLWSTPSFPSGHAVLAWAVVAHLFVVAPWFGIVSIPIAFIICLSRVLVGVHYVSDVIAGACLGIGGSLLLTWWFL